jgi:hypothetical protein
MLSRMFVKGRRVGTSEPISCSYEAASYEASSVKSPRKN